MGYLPLTRTDGPTRPEVTLLSTGVLCVPGPTVLVTETDVPPQTVRWSPETVTRGPMCHSARADVPSLRPPLRFLTRRGEWASGRKSRE